MPQTSKIRPRFSLFATASMALLGLDACKTQADATTLDSALPAASAPPAPPSASAAPRPPAHPLQGEWERQSEPYRGMRVSIRGDSPSSAIVTQPSTVGADANALRRAQLECQRSLWKTGEVLVSGLRPSGERAWEGSIIVRDWGLTSGVCRHQDANAPIRITLSGDDALAFSVTRGKTVTQTWKRVGP